MSAPWKFNYRPEVLPPGWRLVTAGEAIAQMLKRLEDPAADRYRIRVELIQLYRYSDRMEEAVAQARLCVEEAGNADELAGGWLKLGQLAEQRLDFVAAIGFYARVLEVSGCDPWYAYFGRNNMGYSLNQLDRYIEAEGYCREAIRVDPDRHNAHKNLAVSLEGQGRYAAAAGEYVMAVRRNASDPRALKHLEDLVLRHPEVLESVAGLREELVNCRKAVRFVDCVNKQMG